MMKTPLEFSFTRKFIIPTDGLKLLKNFLVKIAKVPQIGRLQNLLIHGFRFKKTIGNDKVVLGLSGGVDSSVAAVLLHKAIGKNLYCIFVNNGLLRKNEFDEVLTNIKTWV